MCYCLWMNAAEISYYGEDKKFLHDKSLITVPTGGHKTTNDPTKDIGTYGICHCIATAVVVEERDKPLSRFVSHTYPGQEVEGLLSLVQGIEGGGKIKQVKLVSPISLDEFGEYSDWQREWQMDFLENTKDILRCRKSDGFEFTKSPASYIKITKLGHFILAPKRETLLYMETSPVEHRGHANLRQNQDAAPISIEIKL